MSEQETVVNCVDNQWDGMPMPPRIYAIAAILLGLLCSVLSTSIANVSLPTIASQLGVSNSQIIWVVNAYQLATVVLILPLSNIGEMVGYRRVYLVGILIFSVSSLFCALSNSFVLLIFCRMLQGVGAACLSSVNTSLVRIVYPKRFLARGMGLNASVVAVSGVAGPSVAALILSFAHWPWLFAVNVPVGLLSFVVGYFVLPDNPVKSADRRFDFKSALLSMFTFLMMFMATEGFCHSWNWMLTLGFAVAFLLVGAVFLNRQFGMQYPVFPVDLFKISIFRFSIFTSVCSFTAQMLALISLPFLLQRWFGFDVVQTGLIMSCWPLVIMVAAPLSGWVVSYIHPGVLGSAGLSLLSVGLLAIYFLPSSADSVQVCWRLAMCGLGFGLFQSPNNSTIIGSAPVSRSGAASGMLSTARLIGQTTGASLVALFLMLMPEGGYKFCLLAACLLAFAGATFSVVRIRYDAPQRS